MSKGPYKDADKMMGEVESFLKDHSAMFRREVTRIGNYFEMNCFNYVVKYYETRGYAATAQNLKDGFFRYKISAAGNHNNFSYFLVSKQYDGELYEFEVHHNLPLECAQEKDIFYTADISVINKGAAQRGKPETYSTNRSFCPATDVQTFFEVKHLPPFPELLFSFSGIPASFLITENRKKLPVHIAPSLLISGRPNTHGQRIKDHLEKRFTINIIADLFNTYSAVYSKLYSKNSIGSLVK